MAVGIYKLPVCDGCNLPWLPVGWTQDSDPRNLPVGAKALRCGKCKTPGWDKKYVAESHADAVELSVSPFDPSKTIEMPRNIALNEALERTQDSIVPSAPPVKLRCRHRVVDCSICNPKEDV